MVSRRFPRAEHSLRQPVVGLLIVRTSSGSSRFGDMTLDCLLSLPTISGGGESILREARLVVPRF